MLQLKDKMTGLCFYVFFFLEYISYAASWRREVMHRHHHVSIPVCNHVRRQEFLSWPISGKKILQSMLQTGEYLTYVYQVA